MKRITILSLSCVLLFSLAGCNNDQTSASGTNPFADTWLVSFAGSFSGSSIVTIADDGSFSFTAALTGFSGSFRFSGSVSYTGNVNGDISYGTTNVGSLTGTLNGDSGNGTYQTTAGNGTWSASRQ
jgi:hypothetical protein